MCTAHVSTSFGRGWAALPTPSTLPATCYRCSYEVCALAQSRVDEHRIREYNEDLIFFFNSKILALVLFICFINFL